MIKQRQYMPNPKSVRNKTIIGLKSISLLASNRSLRLEIRL